jgi:hypothetical protein
MNISVIPELYEKMWTENVRRDTVQLAEMYIKFHAEKNNKNTRKAQLYIQKKIYEYRGR